MYRDVGTNMPFDIRATKYIRSCIAWKKIKEAILPKRFRASIAVVDEGEMRRIRRILRSNPRIRRFTEDHKKINVLSFLLGSNEGEIILNADLIRKEARRYGMPFRARLARLFIHGLLHLKGYGHASKEKAARMEAEEKKIYTESI